MQKICFVTYQFKTGGVERIFSALSNNLDAEIALFTVTNRYDSMKNTIPSTVEIIPIHSNKWFRFLWYLNNYIPIIPFIFILFSEILYLRFSRKYNKYTFVNFSDTISSMIVSYFGSKKSKVYSWLHYNPKTINKSKFAALYKAIYIRMHKIICICHEQKKLMLDVIPELSESNIVVIYNIMDFNNILALKNEKIDYDHDYILMIARFDFRSKDFYTLIDAYHMLSPQIKNSYKLLLMGDGPDLPAVKEHVQLKSEYNNIIFIGKEDNPYKWIDKAHALVLSSKTEGLPTVLIEALICGTPAISTTCETGPKEILDNGECGILVPVGDVNSLSNAMETILYNTQLRSKFIANGKIKAQQFHPRNIIPQVQSLWEM